MVLCYHLAIPYLGLTTQLGVDLFFVLSGFLISGLLFKDYREYGTIRLKRFWVRRAFKILPSLYAYSVVVLALTRSSNSWNGFVSAALYCMNYRPVHSLFLPMWSISVEEQFYLLLPLLILVLTRYVPKPLDKLPWVLLLLIGIVTVLRLTLPDLGFNRLNAGHLEVRSDPLLFGVLLRYINDFHPSWFQRASRFTMIPGLLFWIPSIIMRTQRCSHLTYGLLYSGTVLGCCCLLNWCHAHGGTHFWSWWPSRVIALVGTYSYSIYIWHPLILSCLKHASFPPTLWYVAGLSLSLMVGVCMGKLIEMPALRLRERGRFRRIESARQT